MKKLIVYFLIFSCYLFASELKNNQTIILSNTVNIENAKAFIKKNIKNQKEPIFIFKSDKYYITSYGIYNSKEDVSKAIKNLPQNLKNQKPYRMELSYDLYEAIHNRSNLVYFKDIKKDKITFTEKKVNILEKKNETLPPVKSENENFLDSFSIGFGQNKSSNNIFRLGIQKNFKNIIYENRYGYLGGFYDVSLNKWSYDDSDVYGMTLSPVFVYYFKTNLKKIKPYLEAGIGASYISTTSTAQKNFSTRFQFEDRFGFGFESKSYRLSFLYFHYSNSDIKKPNDGMDMFILNFTHEF